MSGIFGAASVAGVMKSLEEIERAEFAEVTEWVCETPHQPSGHLKNFIV